jgi:hypothetical protein
MIIGANIMKNETFVKLAGIHCVICGILHIPLPFIFKWSELLVNIPEEGRNVIGDALHIMNWCMTVGWFLLAYILIRFSRDMLVPGIGRTLLISMVIFWTIRIFILQPYYMGITSPISIQMLVNFFIGLFLFVIPLARTMRISKK